MSLWSRPQFATNISVLIYICTMRLQRQQPWNLYPFVSQINAKFAAATNSVLARLQSACKKQHPSIPASQHNFCGLKASVKNLPVHVSTWEDETHPNIQPAIFLTETRKMISAIRNSTPSFPWGGNEMRGAASTRKSYKCTCGPWDSYV